LFYETVIDGISIFSSVYVFLIFSFPSSRSLFPFLLFLFFFLVFFPFPAYDLSETSATLAELYAQARMSMWRRRRQRPICSGWEGNGGTGTARETETEMGAGRVREYAVPLPYIPAVARMRQRLQDLKEALVQKVYIYIYTAGWMWRWRWVWR
jgi:hypothetical protein